MGKRHERKARLQMAKRLPLFGIADPYPPPPNPPDDLALPRFLTFPQEFEETAFYVFSRGWLLTLIYVFLRLFRSVMKDI